MNRSFRQILALALLGTPFILAFPFSATLFTGLAFGQNPKPKPAVATKAPTQTWFTSTVEMPPAPDDSVIRKLATEGHPELTELPDKVDHLRTAFQDYKGMFNHITRKAPCSPKEEYKELCELDQLVEVTSAEEAWRELLSQGSKLLLLSLRVTNARLDGKFDGPDRSPLLQYTNKVLELINKVLDKQLSNDLDRVSELYLNPLLSQKD